MHGRVGAIGRGGLGAISRRSAAVIVLVIIFVVLLALGLMASTASARQMTVFSCHDPAGNAVGDYGWTQERSPGNFIELTDDCAGAGAGALSAELSGRSGGYANLERAMWIFGAPSWATIAHYAIHVAGSYTYPNTGQTGEGQVYVQASDESDPYYDYRALGGGTLGAVTVERTPPDSVTSVAVNASCDGFLGPCPGPPEISRIEVSQATFVLDDGSTPTARATGGALLSGAPVSGTAEATFQAQDSGPGIYSARFVVDGAPQPPVVLDNNDGLCENLGQTSNGTRSFSSPEPCAKNVEGALALETTRWPNGAHHVQLLIDDAAGNQVSAFNGTITFDNPLPSPAPPPSTPNGAGASEGATLHLAAGASISRTYARRSFVLRGRLLGPQGQPIEGATLDFLQQPLAGGQGTVIAHAATGTGGSFAVRVPAGPSRIVEIAYRAFAEDQSYAAHAQITEYVDAGARLRVSPSSTNPTGTIVLSGRVLGAIPRHGVLAELLVHYRGRWEPFRTPRTDAQGRFRVVYQFEGAVGSFPFRVKVPGDQAGFAFSTGYSRSVSVSTD